MFDMDFLHMAWLDCINLEWNRTDSRFDWQFLNDSFCAVHYRRQLNIRIRIEFRMNATTVLWIFHTDLKNDSKVRTELNCVDRNIKIIRWEKKWWKNVNELDHKEEKMAATSNNKQAKANICRAG